MELYEKTPLKYRNLLLHYPPEYCLGDLTLSDIMLCFLVECLDIPMGYHPIVVADFKRATELWHSRLQLHGLSHLRLNSNWADNLPYLLAEYCITENVELLQERLTYWVQLIHNGCRNHIPLVML